MRTLIHDLKYKRMRPLASLLALLLSDALGYYDVVLPRHAVLVPIPLHAGRRRVRGFNQSLLVAKHLALRVKREYREDVLTRRKYTKPQVGLLAEDRRENIKDSFWVSDPGRVAGRTVILLDDVKTTGATLEEAASVLKQAGAERIWAVTIAH